MTMENEKSNLLSKRMLSVVKMVTPGNRAADIGCDHGFVSIYLAQNHISPTVIAMDINDGPLLRAKEHVESYGLSEYITVRKSDGITELQWTIPGQRTEADTLIIAGMGGRLINRILSDSMDKVKAAGEIILQPQSEIFLVRKFLIEHGFQITMEDMVYEEDKYYQIIKAVPVNEQVSDLSEAELYFGPCLIAERNQVLYQYLIREAKKFKSIIDNIRGNSENHQKESISSLQRKWKLAEETLNLF